LDLRQNTTTSKARCISETERRENWPAGGGVKRPAPRRASGITFQKKMFLKKEGHEEGGRRFSGQKGGAHDKTGATWNVYNRGIRSQNTEKVSNIIRKFLRGTGNEKRGFFFSSKKKKSRGRRSITVKASMEPGRSGQELGQRIGLGRENV